MLSFIVAPSGYGKTYSIITEINEILDRNEGKKIFVIVPEQESVKVEAELLTFCGNRINADVEVINFSRLANRVFREAGGMTYDHIDTSRKDLITAVILEGFKASCPTFDKACNDVEYIRLIRKEMDTLRSRGIHPDDIIKAGQQLLEEDRGGNTLSVKLSDFATAFALYEKTLKDNASDATDDIVRLADVLSDYDFFDGAYVYIDGFYDYTAPQYSVIEKIMKSCHKLTVTFSLLLNDSEDIFRKTSLAYNKLRECAEKNNIEYICTELSTNHRAKSDGLKALSEAIMTGEDLHSEDKECVTFTASDTPYDECVYVAREIIKLVKGGEVTFSEIAVCAANIATYASNLENVFQTYGIPHLNCTEKSVMQTPVISTVMSALNVVNSSFYSKHIRTYLKSNYLGLTEEEAYALENYVLLWNLNKKSWYSGDAWNMHPKGYRGEPKGHDAVELEIVNKARYKVFEPLKRLADRFADRSTVKEKAEALAEYLDALDIANKVEKYNCELAETFGESTYDDEISAWNSLLNALDMLVEDAGNISVGRDRFIKYLSLLLSDMSFRKIPSSLDEVELGDVEFVRNKNIKHLFFIGFNDGIFPAVSDTPSFFTESEREWLYNHEIKLEDSAEDRLRDQSFHFLLAALRPSHALHLVYHLSSAEGSKSKSSPSYFSAVVCDVLGITPIKDDDNTPVTPHELMEYILSNNPAEDDAFSSQSARAFYNEASQIKKFVERVTEPFYIDTEFYANNQKLIMTQSKLEKYEKCHFSYFVEYMLKTRVRKKAEFSYSEIGSYVHKILEDVLIELTSDGKDIATASLDGLDAIVTRKATEYIESVAPNVNENSPKFKYLVENICSFVHYIIENIIDEFSVSLFRPEYFEEDIGESDVVSPYVLDLSDGSQLVFKGIVDRVDTYVAPDGTEYIRVVDYKTRTGGKSFSLEDVLNGMNLQMLIYLFAFTKQSNNRKRAEAGIMYMPAVKDEFRATDEFLSDSVLREQIDTNLKRSGMYLNDRQIIDAMESGVDKRFVGLKYDKKNDEYKANSVSTLATLEQFGIVHRYMNYLFDRIISELRSGNIEANPIEDNSAGGSVCSYCPYHAICRFEGEPREKKQSKFPLVTMQEELGEITNKE